MGIKVEGIADGMVDLSDLGLKLVVVAVVTVQDMVVQAQDPVHVQIVVEYIKVLAICPQEPVLDVGKLDIFPEHVHILTISRHTLRVHLLQLFS